MTTALILLLHLSSAFALTPTAWRRAPRGRTVVPTPPRGRATVVFAASDDVISPYDGYEQEVAKRRARGDGPPEARAAAAAPRGDDSPDTSDAAPREDDPEAPRGGTDPSAARAQRLKRLLEDEDFAAAERESAAALEVLPELAEVALARGRALLMPLLDRMIEGAELGKADFEDARVGRAVMLAGRGDAAAARGHSERDSPRRGSRPRRGCHVDRPRGRSRFGARVAAPPRMPRGSSAGQEQVRGARRRRGLDRSQRGAASEDRVGSSRLRRRGHTEERADA